MKKYLYFLLGAATLGLGIIFAIPSGVGLGAFDALSFNGSAFYGLTIGIVMNIHILSLLIVLMILRPSKRFLLGALLSLSTGVFIDIYNLIIHLPDLGNYNFVYFFMALPFFPVGVGMMINSTVPVGPIEQLPLLLADMLNVKYVYTKTSLEVVYVLLALLYGVLGGIGIGSIMIGTIIITFYIGPAIAFCRSKLPKIKEA